MNRSLRPLFTTLICWLLMAPSAFSLDVVRGEVARSLNSYLVKEAEDSFSGVVLIAKRGEVILHRAYGTSDVAATRANTVDTVFDIGSMAQVFTSLAVLRLEEDGLLSTSDSLQRFFPDVPQDKRRITIHHLLSHSSGLADLPAAEELPGLNREQTVQRILSSQLVFGPGQQYAYSEAGYRLLAALVERVSGKSFQGYLRETILEPAGLQHTGFRDEQRLGKTMARGYQAGSDRGTPAEWPAPGWADLGSGGMVSTAEDLFRFQAALESDKLLQPETRLRMETAYSLISANTFFGYGWQVKNTAWGFEVGSSAAGNSGFNSMLRRVVDQGLVVIVLANRSQPGAFPVLPVTRGILDVLLESGFVAID